MGVNAVGGDVVGVSAVGNKVGLLVVGDNVGVEMVGGDAEVQTNCAKKCWPHPVEIVL